jgi:hypothetical protein
VVEATLGPTRVGCIAKKIKMVELQKFKSLRGCIAKIEILDVELKIASNFGEAKYNLP